MLGRDYLRAAIVTALVPSVAGAILLWLVPPGCDLRGDPEFYRWTCLFPGLLIPVSIALAVLLPMAILLNRRFGRPVPDGWLATILIAAAATQAVCVGGYAVMLGPAYAGLFLKEMFFVPQPFLCGAVAAGVFSTALRR
jgi:hypothetical protein